MATPAGELPAVSARPHRRRLPVVMGLCFLVMGGVVVMAVFGSIIRPHGTNAQNIVLGLSKPSASHWLGTDSLGRDVLSRVIAGARVAILGPLVVAVVSALGGNVLGLLAGFKGGRMDGMIMRWVDLMLSLPGLLLIIVVAGMVQGGYWLAVVLLALLTVPFDTRVIRGATLEQAPRPYVEAARTLGISDWRIMTSHIWPNVAPIAVANAFLIFSGALVALAGLSFLGLGASPGTPDWGLMIAEGQPLLFANPVAALAPAAILVVTAIAMNLIGDWLYDQLSSRGATR